MANVVIVGYGQMLNSIIEGAIASNNNVLGVFRVDRTKYSPFELFLKDIFNPTIDYTNIKSRNLLDIKAKSVNDEKFIKTIKKLNPDMILIGSWGEKFKKEILSVVPCINFHPALLPKNRGANPYFWSIYLNQEVSGLTIHYMNEEFDKGDILLQEAITIDENETGKSLKDKTCALAKVMTAELLNLADKKQLQPIKQDEKFASYEHQLTLENITLDLNKEAIEVKRHLRALYPFSKPCIKFRGKYIYFSKYEFLELDETSKDKENYTIIEKNNNSATLKGNGYLIKIFK